VTKDEIARRDRYAIADGKRSPDYYTVEKLVGSGHGERCLQRYKTEPVYRRKNEPPLAGCFLSLC
jgi:hypothetical protein